MGQNWLPRLLLLVLSLLSTRAALGGGVTVDINSGNPRYPFPQFNAYRTGMDTLAQVNAPGVPHAELEKTTREAYQIMANGFRADAVSYGGVQYLYFDPPTNKGPEGVSEGDGYAMLAAAYMGDKTTFDGLWMYVHDNRMNNVLRYRDCLPCAGDTRYGRLPGWKNIDCGSGGDANSATDGDVDIALGLLMAWYQWGDWMGINDACGNPISYRQAALEMIRGMVEKAEGDVIGDNLFASGDIGFDGYVKKGNTWGELTGWASTQPGDRPQMAGPGELFVDYIAPGYFDCFAQFLAGQGDSGWNVDQYLRAEASSDWLMGQLVAQNPRHVADAGKVTIAGITPAFVGDMAAEDMRLGWRTILNFVWNGNPTTTWNPTTHQVQPGGNAFERDLALRHAQFLANNQGPPWNNPCVSYGSSPVTYSGPPAMGSDYNVDGSGGPGFHLNWMFGSGAPAAIGAQNFSLMAEMYREAEIEWDIEAPAADTYLNSRPKYFHDWFRLLSMLVLTGNKPSPCNLVPPGSSPPSNLKIYKSVDKTFAFQGDTLTYWLNYRNFASTTATGVSISDVLPPELGYLSAAPGPSSAPAPGNSGTIIWNRPNLPGLQNQNYSATMAGITIVARVLGVSGRVCNVSAISTSNGSGWTSNEYPNNVSDVMERNCVDIVSAALELTKTASTASANPGMAITYTIDFLNSSDVGWLNGGRPGVVAAFANNGNAAADDEQLLKFRLYHGADEAYINYKNYRISYFLNDAAHTQLGGPPAASWGLATSVYEGGDPLGVTFGQESVVPGTDAIGAWNQRILIRFSDQLVTTAPHLYNYYGMAQRIHRGGDEPLRGVWRLYTADNAPINWTDDWSADALANQADGGGYFPVTNDWTDPLNPNLPVTRLHKHACEIATHTVDNVLVEEWDGYTWRRAFGNGPAPGREIINARLRDTLSANVDWGGFIETPALGTTTYNAATRAVQWDKPTMLVNEGGRIRYYVTVKPASHFGGCPVASSVTNTATIQGDAEAPVSDSVTVAVTCDPVPTPTPAPSTLTKTASTSTPASGSNVTWTVAYTQAQGTIVDRPAPNAGNWTGQSGPAFTYGATSIANVANSSQVATYNYSHGTNGTITATVSLASYSTFGIALRHTGGAIGNGLYMTFKHNPPNSEVAFYNGSTLIGASTVSFGSSFDFKLVLTGGTASLWINTLTGPPLVTQTGLPVRAGYAGVINGYPSGADTWGNHTLSNWWTNLDSAFDLQISDPVPAGLSFVSANNGGSFGAGRVSWPVVAGPVLAGTPYTHQWVSTVTAGCGSSITNTAYANMRGQPTDTIGDAVVITVTCAGTPTFTPTRTASATATRSPSPTPTPSFSPSGTPSRTASPSLSPSPSPSASPSGTPSRTPSASPSVTPSGSPSRTASGTPSESPSSTPTRTASVTVTVTFLDTYTVSPTISPTRSATPSGTPSVSPSNTRTASPTITRSPTDTPVASATSTRTVSPSPSASPTASPTGTPSATPSDSPTRTGTPTATSSFTASPVYTPTVTPTATPSFTDTATRTASPTPSATPSATPTATASATLTATRTATSTSTATRTATASATLSATRTISPTPTDSPTQSVTPSVTETATPYISPTISATFSVSPTQAIRFYQQDDLVKERGVYPNPFSEHVRLFFTLRVDAVAKLTVYNVAGEPLFVRDYPLLSGKREIVWDGINDAGGRCASGIYILRLQAEGVDKSIGGYWTTVAIQR